MFKLKAGNVIQKINKMDRKQAYTWGAIIIVCFVALLMLASFMGDADDTSFDGMSTRGYDLAQMPFVSDEAEAYLLASKYPDMQNNGSSALYSQEEKEARQEEDAENAENEREDDTADNGSSYGDGSSSGRGYGSGGYGGGHGGSGGGKTSIGQLGSASVGHASGSGVSSTWGAPRGDFSTFKSQDKGTEIPAQFRNTDAKKALFQTAQGSRAAAGYKDGKARNATKALMGGNIRGSEAFGDNGVDLSKTGGLELDTNAPVTSPDLSNLDKDLTDAAKKAKEEKDKEKESLADRLKEQLLSGFINMGMDALGNAFNRGVNSLFGLADANKASKQFGNDFLNSMDACRENPSCKGSAGFQANAQALFGENAGKYINGDSNIWDFAKDTGIGGKQSLRSRASSVGSQLSTTRDEEGNFTQIGATKAVTKEEFVQQGNGDYRKVETTVYEKVPVTTYNTARSDVRAKAASDAQDRSGWFNKSYGKPVERTKDDDYEFNSKDCKNGFSWVNGKPKCN